MDVFLDGAKVRLLDSELLGEGGEARVYRWGDLALKVFHSPDALKVQKLKRFPAGLPAQVVTPRSTLHDRRGNIVGYAMRAVVGHEELARLAQRRFREGALSNPRVMELFEQLRTTLSALHGRGVVVGDLNDGNVLFDQGLCLIDADSMQFDGLPCTVAHERTLAPELFGVDLTRGVHFSAGTDWYAWNVLLFSSLLYVHPFGGVHPKWPTLLRRAQARHSVLRPDVVYPTSAVHHRVLSDDALHHFSSVFDHGQRSAPPAFTWEWSTCRCGLTHARARCPDCQHLGPASARAAIRNHGKCSARTLFATHGRILEAALQGGPRYVYEEAQTVRREDGSPVIDGTATLGMRFGIAGSATWVAERSGSLRKVQAGRVVERAHTGVRGTRPVFAASSRFCYRLEQEWLVEQVSGDRIGQVLEGQTWFWCGERLGLGLYRAAGLTHVFMVRVGQSGLCAVRHVPGGKGPVVELPGRLVEASCVFDDQHALLSTTCEHAGQLEQRLWLFNAAGQRLAAGEGVGRGRALLCGRVVLATDEGLMSMRAQSGELLKGTLFSDTQPFVGADDELLAQPDGSLLVVGQQQLVQLSLSP